MLGSASTTIDESANATATAIATAAINQRVRALRTAAEAPFRSSEADPVNSGSPPIGPTSRSRGREPASDSK